MNRLRTVYVALLIGFAFVTSTCDAQATLPPIKRLFVARDAALFLDSLATHSRDARVETAGCLVSYSVRDTVLTLERFAHAVYFSADSLTINTRGADGPICPEGAPVVHSHVALNAVNGPSQLDQQTAIARGTWNLLLSVYDNGWRVRLY